MCTERRLLPVQRRENDAACASRVIAERFSSYILVQIEEKFWAHRRLSSSENPKPVSIQMQQIETLGESAVSTSPRHSPMLNPHPISSSSTLADLAVLHLSPDEESELMVENQSGTAHISES